MALQLSDQWLWDFWFAQDGPDYHIFYLQADRALHDETRRHWNVSIGHAVSTDLIHWEVLPDALAPRREDDAAWDNHTTWTGSIIQHAGQWWMFYTGANRQDQGLVQRIGLATSDDLLTWQRYGEGPLVEADPRWYELLDLEMWHDQAWRDPWVMQHPATGEFHMLITARANNGPKMERGVIGHARSTDLLEWEVLPPLVAPRRYGYLEVPQVVQLEGRYYLIFSSVPHFFAPSYAHPVEPEEGTHYMVSDFPLGPYDFLDDKFLVGDPKYGGLYSGKLMQRPDGDWCFMSFRNFTVAGEFIGELHDPLPLEVLADGRLRVERA